MASQSLYRKWRSQTFNELVGQEAVIRTLKNALSSGKLAHAYLFTGPRGTGKTTTARLLAKTINCLNPQHGEPCNECQQCREITAGTSFDVIEIDAASNRGIDSIRDLREKVMMRPSSSKYKVYVLDEAHMLTTEAFNALLKTLEEPPEYAIFVLATTDVHKMLPTVLSRCQRFDFKRITARQIVGHLNYVAGQEGVSLDKGAAELIARAAAGGMRDALSLLDQSIAYAGQEVALSQVQAMLGVADPRTIHALMQQVADMDNAAGLHQINELVEAGADLRQVNAQVIEYWRALMLTKAGADVATILDRTQDEVDEIRAVAQYFGLEELTQCARVFAQNELVQKNQGTPQLGLELAFLECVEVHRRTQTGQAPSQPVVTPSRPVNSPPPSHSAPASAEMRVTRPAPVEKDIPETREDRSAPSPGRISRDETPEPAPVAPQHAPPELPVENEAAAIPPLLTLEQVSDVWDNVKKRVKQKDIKTGACLDYFTLIAVEGTAELPVIVMQAKNPYYNFVNSQNRHTPVEWALKIEFGFGCRVRLLPPGQQLSSTSTRTTIHAPSSAPSTRPEHPATAPPAARTPAPERRKQEPQNLNIQTHDPPADSTPEPDPPTPLARTDVVRENRNGGTTPPRMLETKANADPVVREVMRTFGAKATEIRQKQIRS